MSRKNPSSHSDRQFALFVEEMRGGIEGIDHARFTEMVRNLVRTDLQKRQKRESIVSARPILTHEVGNRCDSPSEMSAAVASLASNEEAGDDSRELMSAIGQLVLQWSISQRLLIRLLALMLEIDVTLAAVIFATLGTTQLRMDLLRRMVPLKVADHQARLELGKIFDDLDAAGRVRSDLLGAVSPSNDRGDLLPASVLRFGPTGSGDRPLEGGKAVARDLGADVVAACAELQRLGTALQRLMPRLKGTTSTRGGEMAAD